MSRRVEHIPRLLVPHDQSFQYVSWLTFQRHLEWLGGNVKRWMIIRESVDDHFEASGRTNRP